MEEIQRGWSRVCKKVPNNLRGVIAGVSNVKNQVYCRELVCVYCGQSKWKMELSDEDSISEECCADQVLKPQYEECKQSR